MPVYMLANSTRTHVKIGQAKDVQFRIANIQAMNWDRLHLLRVLVGGEAEEAMLHRRFKGLRLHGEWFQFTEAMLGDVGLADADQTPPAPDAATEMPDGFDPRLWRQSVRAWKGMNDETGSVTPRSIYLEVVGVAA